MTRFILPLGLFLALALTLGMGLRHQSDLRDPSAVPSPLVGRQLPAFDVPVLTSVQAGETHFQPSDLKGQVWLLNVWASWCASCASEHPVLVAQARGNGVTVVGFNYQDGPEPARQWLSRHGNPFRLTFADPTGRLGLDLGIVAVPETFLIDQQGRIRHKFTGPLSEGDWRTTLLPKLRELQGV
jgi:cytochrome c biogenesis protein CcmG/thiol:disulfide interchange protein DsbE